MHTIAGLRTYKLGAQLGTTSYGTSSRRSSRRSSRPCTRRTSQADVVRYRPLLLLLAAGKTASSLGSLGFFLFDEDVFAYLLNFLVDGSLALLALWLWSLAGRIDRPPGARLKARAGALGRRAAHPERDLRSDGPRHRRAARG